MLISLETRITSLSALCCNSSVIAIIRRSLVVWWVGRCASATIRKTADGFAWGKYSHNLTPLELNTCCSFPEMIPDKVLIIARASRATSLFLVLISSNSSSTTDVIATTLSSNAVKQVGSHSRTLVSST